jgi:hypothetical protein
MSTMGNELSKERGRRLIHNPIFLLETYDQVCNGSLSIICSETELYQSLPPSKREQRADIKVLGSASLVRFSVKRIRC